MIDEPQSQDVQAHYATPRHLATRGSFQAKYATVGWFGWLVDRMGLEAGAQILDVGCGPAWLWRAQADRVPDGLRVSLIDASPGMIAEARTVLATIKRIACVDTQVADAVALPHPAETFDAVLLLHVLYHVSDPGAALDEAWRVLRPGGRVFVSTNARDNMQALHRLGAQALGGPAVDPGAALFSLDDAETLVSAAFTTVERHDLIDVMTCTDPDDAVAFLLSMPPGNAASKQQQDHLAALIHDESLQAGGGLRTTRRNGLVIGTKAL